MQLNLNKDLYSDTNYYFIGKLSPKSKHFLTLPEDGRTGGALTDLLSQMETMDFFQMFSNRTKELLTKKMAYVVHPADSILQKQGERDEPPQAMFVILSGVVIQVYKPSDVGSESSKIWPEKIMRKGQYFGYADIVYDRPPSVDAQTVGYSELLMLRREDFGIVSKVLETRCSRLRHYLDTMEVVSRFGWSEMEQIVLEMYSRIRTYTDDQQVYGHTENEKPSWSHFVVSGECRILRELAFTVSETGHLKAWDSNEPPKSSKLCKDRIVVEEVKRGFYCGIGEEFCNNYVIAVSTVECLLIPRLLLVFKDKQLLQKMVSDLTNSLPSDQEILDKHSKLVSASEKNIKMFKEMFKNKPDRLNID